MVTCQADTIIVDGVRISVKKRKKEVAWVYLYILRSDYHKKNIGYLGDLFIDEMHRNKEIETQLLMAVTKEARKGRCYKVTATSKHDQEPAHKFYEQSGFASSGTEFRMNL